MFCVYKGGYSRYSTLEQQLKRISETRRNKKSVMDNSQCQQSWSGYFGQFDTSNCSKKTNLLLWAVVGMDVSTWLFQFEDSCVPKITAELEVRLR